LRRADVDNTFGSIGNKTVWIGGFLRDLTSEIYAQKKKRPYDARTV